jgi:hypothetical protein
MSVTFYVIASTTLWPFRCEYWHIRFSVDPEKTLPTHIGELRSVNEVGGLFGAVQRITLAGSADRESGSQRKQ